jgi:hypothetical protein
VTADSTIADTSVNGLTTEGSAATLERVRFVDNNVADAQGVLYVGESARALLRSTTFEGNTGAQAFLADKTSLLFTDEPAQLELGQGSAEGVGAASMAPAGAFIAENDASLQKLRAAWSDGVQRVAAPAAGSQGSGSPLSLIAGAAGGGAALLFLLALLVLCRHRLGLGCCCGGERGGSSLKVQRGATAVDMSQVQRAAEKRRKDQRHMYEAVRARLPCDCCYVPEAAPCSADTASSHRSAASLPFCTFPFPYS